MHFVSIELNFTINIIKIFNIALEVNLSRYEKSLSQFLNSE